MSAHYDGKRFYNTNGADKGAGDISKFLSQNLWNKENWPKNIENPPADPSALGVASATAKLLSLEIVESFSR